MYDKIIDCDLPWIDTAMMFIDLHEIKGNEHDPDILQMWKDIKRGGIKDDETPWCAAFVGSCLERNNIKSTRFESAKSYLDWGVKLDKPIFGCVAIFNRKGGGHVGFVVGKQGDSLLILGGNQSDAVNIKAFSKSTVVGYRFPIGWAIDNEELPDGVAEVATKIS